MIQLVTDEVYMSLAEEDLVSNYKPGLADETF